MICLLYSVNPSLQGKHLHSESLESEPARLAVMNTTPAQSFDVAVSLPHTSQIALLQVSQHGSSLKVSKDTIKTTVKSILIKPLQARHHKCVRNYFYSACICREIALIKGRTFKLLLCFRQAPFDAYLKNVTVNHTVLIDTDVFQRVLILCLNIVSSAVVVL